jgi:Xaa-Pro aminopeptidase
MIAGSTPVPGTEIAARITRLQERLREADLDGALIAGVVNLYYLSGTTQQSHLLVPAEGEAVLLTRRHLARAREESPLACQERLPRLGALPERVRAALGRAPARLGLELDILPVALFRRYERLFPETELVDVSRAIREQRMIKSPYEIELVRAAGEQLRLMYEELPGVLREGMDELELAAWVEYRLRLAGHHGGIRMRAFNAEVFYGNVLTGPHGAVRGKFDGPTCGPGLGPGVGCGAGSRRIVRGEPVFLDIVGGAGGYLCDQTRIFAIGDLDPELRRAHEVCMAIEASVLELARPGVACRALYERALAMAAEEGLADHLMGPPGDQAAFLGHGIGLELDEWPVLSARAPWTLAPGMVLAIEPKMIFPGRGAVGLENTWVVREHGLERLTALPNELTIVSGGGKGTMRAKVW